MAPTQDKELVYDAGEMNKYLSQKLDSFIIWKFKMPPTVGHKFDSVKMLKTTS